MPSATADKPATAKPEDTSTYLCGYCGTLYTLGHRHEHVNAACSDGNEDTARIVREVRTYRAAMKELNVLNHAHGRCRQGDLFVKLYEDTKAAVSAINGS